MSKFMINLGLNPEDLEKSEKFAQLSEKLPHIVPDIMQTLFEKYRFTLYNLSLEIEGKKRCLENIELIQSLRLKKAYKWPKASMHKLIFKKNQEMDSLIPSLRELRLNKNLFPKTIFKMQNKFPNVFVILSVYDNQFHLIKKLIITDSNFTNSGWLSIDISKISYDFVLFIKFSKVFLLNDKGYQRIQNKVSIPFTDELYLYYAYIINFYKNKYPMFYGDRIKKEDKYYKYSRFKRDLSQYLESHNEHCEKYSLMVKFKEVGWSKWIIAPKQYNAYYCKGNCPYPLSDHFNATNHAIIQLLVHGLKDVAVPKPCCVPYKLSPETLLYLNNEGDALLREFKDMSVNSCSCR